MKTADTKPNIDLPLEGMKKIVVVSVVILVIMAAVRDIYLHVYGTETALRGLNMFRLDAENNFGAWFASLMLASNAFLAFMCARSARAENDGPVSRNWFLISVILVCMSFEEIVGFHERTNDPIRGILNVDGLLYYAWVIPGAFLVAVVGAFFLPFLWKIPRRTAYGLFIAGAIYVSGALGMELIGALLVSQGEFESNQYRLAVLLEETMELSGLAILFWVLSDYIRDRTGAWRLT
ncbi:MAG: hypothetical protein ABJN98_08975 [Roseibium sp.]